LTKQSDYSDIVDRLETAVSNLTEAGIARLCRKGGYLAIGTPDGDGMALNGSREWKPAVSFEVYIFGVMRSIAHAEKHTCQRKTEVLEADFGTKGDDDDPFLAKVADGQGTDVVLVERRRMEALQADIDALARHFEGDDDVELVLAALEDGTARQVLIEDFGMTLTRYESARKKLRRGADTLFRGRRKS